MVRFLEVIVAALIVVVVFVVFALFLPSVRNYEDSIETNRPVRIVFDTLNGFHRFADWSPLKLRDPRIRFSYEGPTFGEGAELFYHSSDPTIGSGSWKLIGSDESGKVKKLVFRLQNPALGYNKTMRIEIERKKKTTEIRQRYRVEYGMNLFGRFAGMYLARTVGEDMDLGLKAMSAMFAAIPNFDYSEAEIETVNIPAQDILFLPTTSPRDIDKFETAVINQSKWLRQVLGKNNLEAAGPMRLVFSDAASENMEFDVVLPVRRKGALTARTVAAADAAGEAVKPEVPGAEDLPALPPIDPASITLEGQVQFGRSYEGKALKVFYKGPTAALRILREEMRAYALAHGLLIHDRPFDEYLNDIEKTAAEEASFNTYWPIK